jgi:hypothetical protein
VISRASGFKNLSSLDDLNNLTGLNDLDNLISSKKLLSLMFLSTLAPKWPILVPQCGMDHQKFPFLLILATFLLKAVEDRDVTFDKIKGS